MYKLIICDDEKTIREGLCNIVDWNSLGFEVCGAFEDGSDALIYAQDNKVDVLLTDIKMYEVSGLALIKQIKHSCPDIVSVILSGYKQFEYAQEAIALGVTAFLIKPIDFPELQDIFRKIRTELDNAAAKQKTLSHHERTYEEQLPLLREQFFLELFEGVFINTSEIEKRASLCELGESFIQTPFILVSFYTQDLESYLKHKWKCGRDRFKVMLRNILAMDLPGDISLTILFSKQMDYNRAVLFGKAAGDLPKINLYLDRKLSEIETLLGIRCDMCEPVLFENFNVFFERMVPLAINSKDTGDSSKELCETLRPILINSLHENNMDMMEITAGRLFGRCLNFEAALKLAQTMMFDVFKSLEEHRIALSENSSLLSCFYSMTASQDIDELKKNFLRLCKKAAKQLHISDITAEDRMMSAVKRYIASNYSKDITLDDVAATVYLSPAYFSAVFRKREGITYSDYLLKVRMEHAKEFLINAKYRISDVCTMSGYNNVKYFTTCFKKFTGSTPSEYRQRIYGSDSRGTQQREDEQ